VCVHVTFLTQLRTQQTNAGFKLDSLLKLQETRARDRKTTLLDFLVATVRHSMPSIEAFGVELALLQVCDVLALAAIA
jgi:hypothetical protein